MKAQKLNGEVVPEWEEETMSRFKILAVTALFTFALGLALAGEAVAEEEVTEVFYQCYTCSDMKSITYGEDHIYLSYDCPMVFIGETGKEMFHNASGHTVGFWKSEKGVVEDRGTVVAILPNGDKVFLAYVSIAKPGVPAKGAHTIIGGTGKCAGIQGTGEYSQTYLNPPIEGVPGGAAGYTKAKLRYRLP
jgi:hypothetical protein